MAPSACVSWLERTFSFFHGALPNGNDLQTPEFLRGLKAMDSSVNNEWKTGQAFVLTSTQTRELLKKQALLR